MLNVFPFLFLQGFVSCPTLNGIEPTKVNSDSTADKLTASVTFFCTPKEKERWGTVFRKGELSYIIRTILNAEADRQFNLKSKPSTVSSAG